MGFYSNPGTAGGLIGETAGAAGLIPIVTVGIVKGFEDKEKKNRLQVILPAHNEIEILAKVLTPSASKEYGSNFYPDVDEEVLVAFPNGCLQNAVILGSLNNDVNKPIVNNLKKENQIEKRKTKAGSEFTWTHDKNKENIEFKTAKSHIITYDGDKEILGFKSQNGQTLMTVKLKDGEIEIKAQKKITLTAGQDTLVLENGKGASVKSNSGNFEVNVNGAKIQSKTNLQLLSNNSAKLEGMTTNVSAKTQLDLKGQAMASVGGGMVKIG